MKKLRAWQTLMLIIVFLGSGGGVYIWRHGSTSASTTLPTNTQLVAVRVGNVTNSVSASGSLSFTNQANLTFGASGTVLQVNVAVGDSVKKGQVLAQQDTTALQSAVTQAQLNLNNAQTNFTNAQTPYTSTDLLKAQSSVAQAQYNLQNAQQQLVTDQTVDPVAVANAQNAVTAAQQALATAKTVDPLVVASAQNIVTQDQIALANAQANQATLMAGPTAAQLASANAAVASAQVALQNATAALPTALPDNLTVSSYSSYLTKQAAFQTAQANLQTAQNNLAILQSSPSAADVTNAQLVVSKAQTALNQAQTNLANAQIIDPLVVAQKQVALTQAQNNLATVQTPDPTVLAKDQVSIANSQAALATANDNLATVQAGADPNNVAAKTLQLQAAQTAYDSSKTALAAATMVAPYDGTVTVVNILVGQSIGGNATAITVVDTSTIEADAVVSEIDVPKVKVGQQANLAVSALPGVPINGKVSVLSVIGRSSSGVVTYPITIQVTPPQGVLLRSGMSVTATLVIQQANNVLLVPNRAIGGTSRNPTVVVVTNGQNQVVPVTLGLSDSSNTQVLTGVTQGEQVLVSTSSTSGGSGGGGIRIIGGGGGGVIPGLPAGGGISVRPGG